MLEADGLSAHFGSLRAVDDVSLHVGDGELTALIGPNGAGKTTLFNLLAGELIASRGTIRLRGEDVTRLGPAERARRGLARSFQINNLFPRLTVRENIRVAAQRRDRRSGSAFVVPLSALREAGAVADRILTEVGLAELQRVQARHLSYGDQRRLEIAIALAAEPELLLLDEPTSGISLAERDGIIALIREVARGHTVLLIEHDMDCVMSICRRVVVMNAGRLIADGTPAAIAGDPLVQEVYTGGAA